MNLAYGQPLGGGEARDIELSPPDRLRSVYFIGSSGSGKSSALETLLVQDIHDGVGFGVFDVEDRLVPRVLRHLVDAGREPVLIDPTIGPSRLNVLHVPEGVHPHTVVEGCLQAFRRAWFDSWGARLEDLLRHSLILFVEQGLTIAELPHFLSDAAWRERVAQASQDQRARSYFLDHLRAISQREVRVWVESTRNKAAAFANNPFIQPSIAAEDCLDFQKLMDEGRPLIVNLPETILGDSGKLLAMLIVSRLYQAALQRREGARPWFLYADEFQNFATRSFIDLVTRSRKRGVGSVIAHQTISQPPFDSNPEFLSSLLANTAVHVVMQVGREDAERFAKEIFPASGTEAKRRKKHWMWGDFGDPQFYSVNEEREAQCRELEHQHQRECFVKVKRNDGTEVFVAQSYDLPEPDATQEQGAHLAAEAVTRFAPGAPRDRLARFLAQKRRRAVDEGEQPGEPD
ncbi:MAG: type IV secretory system conjugative DNA transfer family protein [Candidatus Eisenbacteria bacterium]|uniref:Type IV secretory system conjugative DNA transfer family protein n=1 Tax=Eiseniibacteriota bacterium TaxID=2212470 RepID=A0A849SBD6_UNCEI|nr:type IV secretory system conjugative DNA transfer family protein [Candidatus Eisenbacteria bacterium]